MTTRRIVSALCGAIFIIASVLFIISSPGELGREFAFFFLLCVIAPRLGLVYEALEQR